MSNAVVIVALRIFELAGVIGAIVLVGELTLRVQDWFDRVLASRIRARLKMSVARELADVDPVIVRRAHDRLNAMPIIHPNPAISEATGAAWYNCPFCPVMWVFHPAERTITEIQVVEHLALYHCDRLRGLDRNGPTLAVKT